MNVLSMTGGADRTNPFPPDQGAAEYPGPVRRTQTRQA
jgi:hypothetical protein